MKLENYLSLGQNFLSSKSKSRLSLGRQALKQGLALNFVGILIGGPLFAECRFEG